MRRLYPTIVSLALAAVVCAQEKPYTYKDDSLDVLVPSTSIENTWDAGVRMHTNHLIYRPNDIGPEILLVSQNGPNPSGSYYYSPQQIKEAYNLPATGGSGVICIVDAYDDPNALSDFNTFSSRFNLPTETSTNATSSSNKVFQVVYGSGSQPSANGGWAQEESLDFEWAHALAPKAKIVLVEAASANLKDLFTAESVAADYPGCKEVSNSWGGGEFSFETYYDDTFTKPGVVFFASAGDTGGAQSWPSCSPNVVSCGGTSLYLSANGSRISPETAWNSGGGGPSAYEALPSYQTSLASTIGQQRGTPDVSFDANPSTGVLVYDSYSNGGLAGWLIFGGTSVSSPCLAAIANLAGHNRKSSVDELTNQVYYSFEHEGIRFYDITSGQAGSFKCKSGWDFVTGVGSLHGDGGV
jgi:subtilase family serine protease